MNDVTLDTIGMLLLRHVAGSIAGAIMAHGWANGYTSEQIAGAIVLAGTIGWSWWQKQGQAIALATARRAYNDAVEQLRVFRKPSAPSVTKP